MVEVGSSMREGSARALRKRGWGRVPLLLSMGNAGERARMKRRAQAPRVLALGERKRRRGSRRVREKERNERTSKRTNAVE